MVLRLLYAQERRTLAELGLHPAVESRLRQLVQPEHGLTLVVGATGSGKTTTLHALLAELGSHAGCIATLEDPVEIVCPGALQTDLSQLPQLDFAQGLRSLMRQDPDTLLIGEVRDAETAHLMVHAALTGHRVLASLHAPDCLGALYRLLELGVNWLSLLNGLNGLVAQRLQHIHSPAATHFSAVVRPWAEVLDLSALGRRQVLRLQSPQALLDSLTPACYQAFVCQELAPCA
jgi:type II secretory ATPase GspE/PulE/Tfp pilus assembly ATPase PilB-like protein